MSAMDDFHIIPPPHPSAVSCIYHDWETNASQPTVNTNAQIYKWLRDFYPDFTITSILSDTAPLLVFAEAGHAVAELDTDTESVLRQRTFIQPSHRGGTGHLADSFLFAKYHYRWQAEDFIVYTVVIGYLQYQYILKEPGSRETSLSNCAKTDALIKAVVDTVGGDVNKFVYVFDLYWSRSRELWDEVMKSSWDKVILDEEVKKSLRDVSETFFDSKDVYDRYGVPWKRGLIFAGPPGNGKTISIKALMKTLYERDQAVPTLYVKHAPTTIYLANVFSLARQFSPCLLVLEDIETIVTPATRSYFFNEVDGLTNNSGLLMVASTNYLDKLDPGLSKRPSRFDRKITFPLPDEHGRVLYCEFWRQKLENTHSDLPFPEKLCPAMARITNGFSFAYLQEAFVASLLIIAREAIEKNSDEKASPEHSFHADDNTERKPQERTGREENVEEDLDTYQLWRVFKLEVAELRENIEAAAGAITGSDISSLAMR